MKPCFKYFPNIFKTKNQGLQLVQELSRGGDAIVSKLTKGIKSASIRSTEAGAGDATAQDGATAGNGSNFIKKPGTCMAKFQFYVY